MATAAPYRLHRYPAHLIETKPLDDGLHITVRPVLPQDEALLRDFVAALSPASRRWRFHAGVNSLGESCARRMAEVDYEHEMVLVATVATDDGDERLVAEARYVVTDRRTAEFAIVVADGWAGRGLAQRLLAQLARCAAHAGLRWLRGEVLADNERMLALMQRCGFHLAPSREDEQIVIAERCLELAWPARPVRRLARAAALLALVFGGAAAHAAARIF